ncbi:MAG TPA: hypothetical protein VK667_03770 [Ktedonobacteraceae bacterium]|nr:hypothetical protein [Ktedonobacteraceae bacterium]
MPAPQAPLTHALRFANTHAQRLVQDGNLRIRFGPDGLYLLGDDVDIADGEEEHEFDLSILVPVGTDLLRIPDAALPPRHQHGWQLDVSLYSLPPLIMNYNFY